MTQCKFSTQSDPHTWPSLVLEKMTPQEFQVVWKRATDILGVGERLDVAVELAAELARDPEHPYWHCSVAQAHAWEVLGR